MSELTRIPLQRIVVQRKDGNGVSQNVIPEIGKPFEFTAPEIKDLARMSPDAIREPINEGGINEIAPTLSEAQIAEQTEATVKGLLGDDGKTVPNMEDTNKALKAAGLPAIKAADRDAIIAKSTAGGDTL